MIDYDPLSSLQFLMIAIAVTTAANAVLALISWRQAVRQTLFVPQEPRSPWSLLPWPVVCAIAALGLVYVDPDGRRLIGGGFLMMLVAGAALNVTSVLTSFALRQPDAAEGQLRYSKAYAHRVSAGRFAGLALLFAACFALTLQPAFAGATIFALAGTVVYYGQSRGVARHRSAATQAAARSAGSGG